MTLKIAHANRLQPAINAVSNEEANIAIVAGKNRDMLEIALVCQLESELLDEVKRKFRVESITHDYSERYSLVNFTISAEKSEFAEMIHRLGGQMDEIIELDEYVSTRRPYYLQEEEEWEEE